MGNGKLRSDNRVDYIGGFPIVDPLCAGCGKELLLANAWMTDGCPCNSPLGINNTNETRWRLLMQLQRGQSQSYYPVGRRENTSAYTSGAGAPVNRSGT